MVYVQPAGCAQHHPTQTMKHLFQSSLSAITLAAMLNMGPGAAHAFEVEDKEGPSPNHTASPKFWDEIPRSPSTQMPKELKDAYWHGEFLRVNGEVRQADKTELVFFGDSITRGWSLGTAKGQDVWNDDYARYRPINMGNAGDITPVMLYRVTHGNLDFAEGRQPNVAVLLCGINNLIVTKSAGGEETWDLGVNCPPMDIANGRRAIAQVFRRRLPKTRVIMLALFPVADAVKWATCRQVNAINAAMAPNENEVAYVDLRDQFLLPDGSINKQLFVDGLHLTTEGYRVWAKGLEPFLSKFMQAPPLDPVKIMLIGDSTTEGADSSGAYRRYLDPLLRKGGHLFDFVGSRRRHHDDAMEPDNYEYDTDHEGHWGKRSAWLAENLPRLLNANAPDVAVIHVGTEDICSRTDAAEPLTDEIVRNIDRLINALRQKNKNVRIVLSKVIPIVAREETVKLLNLKIARYAENHSTARQPLVLADPHEGFDVSRDLSHDGTLPSASGAEKMASVFSVALNRLLRSDER